MAAPKPAAPYPGGPFVSYEEQQLRRLQKRIRWLLRRTAIMFLFVGGAIGFAVGFLSR